MSEFLFLDIDDVLNSEQFIEENDVTVSADEQPRAWIDPEAVERLNRILDRTETDPEIILSSTWRHTVPPDEMTQILRDNGFDHTVSDKTPGRDPNRRSVGMYSSGRTMTRRRGLQIQDFLALKRDVDQVDSLVVLDNLHPDKIEPFEEYLVRTRPETGLQDVHVDEAVRILSKDFEGVDIDYE